MNKLLNLLKILDTFIFSKIDSFKTTEHYLKITDSFSSLSPIQQKITRDIFTAALIIPPVLLVLIMFVSNYSLKSNVDTKKTMVNSINKYTSLKKKIDAIGVNILSKKAPQNSNDLKSQIRGTGVNMTKISIKNFKNIKSTNSKNIVNVEADISFKKFSLSELTKFLTQISLKQKARISKIQIKKINNLLKGNIHIKQFGTK